MGHGSYSGDVHRSTTLRSLAEGTDFSYAKDTFRQARSDWKVNPILDPKRENKAGDHTGLIIRESLATDEHPNPTSIAIILDVTGSMGRVPREVIAELPKLMDGLIEGGVPDPQVLIIAIGDAYSDTLPLQVGAFESDNRIDEQINAIVPEGGGGGGNHESYELAAYFLANHTHLDCVELHDQKGFAFFLADERVYAKVNAEQVKNLIGDEVQGNIDTKDVFADLKDKFETFMLYGHGASGRGGDHCMAEDAGDEARGSYPGSYGWKALLDPEQVLFMDAPKDLVTQIATTVVARVGEKAEA